MRLRIRNLRKKFGDALILDNIGCTFEKGILYGIVGKPHSGKSVFLNCISSNEKVNSGYVELEISGRSFIPNYSHFGLITRKSILPDYLTAVELVQYSLDMYRIKNVNAEELLTDLGLDRTVAYHFIKDYDDDQRRFLQMALIILTNPEVILIDEVFDGEAILNFVQKLRGKHVIIMTADDEKDLVNICDELYLLEEGKLLPLEVINA